MISKCFLLIVSLTLVIDFTLASVGDRSPFYQKCVDKCVGINCTNYGSDFKLGLVYPIYLDVFFWSCSDDCKYTCMWKTVDAFIQRSWNIPQFYGKWPFLRIFGIQEPASVLFSFFNFYSHYYMLKLFRREVRKSSPMYWLWHVYSMVCLNCWFWSCVFHTRDFPFTEKMDYISAFVMVLFSFYSMCIRILNKKFKLLRWGCTLLCFLLALHHITYLIFIKFDYGYNMLINIIIGVLNAVGWLLWCWWCRDLIYVWRCASFVILAGACMLLEVSDFPPFFWCFDAHSLWHLGTACLPILFYRFLIDDCKYLRKQQELEVEEKSKEK